MAFLWKLSLLGLPDINMIEKSEKSLVVFVERQRRGSDPLRQFKVAFAGSTLECPCKPRSQFLPPHSKVHATHSCISAKQVLQEVVLIMK